MRDVDVLVLGAGPAGAAAAIALAPTHRVLMVDRRAAPQDRIGESLPAAAGPLLAALGARTVLDGDAHERTQARRSVWGGPEPVELDGLRDPDGLGWRLDRCRFEEQLRACAQDRGVLLLAPTRVLTVRRRADHWLVTLDAATPSTVRAAAVIDAGGRGSRPMRPWKGRYRAADRLVCAWTSAPLRRPAPGITFLESVPGGWWYTAPVPGGRRVLAFHTDADLRPRSTLIALLAAGTAPSSLLATLADTDLTAAGPIRVRAAGGARPHAVAGAGWLAVGDASMSLDPLSAQGLFHALYTGHSAAHEAPGMVGAEPGARYAATLERVWARYCAHRAAFYAQERRWTDQPFWSRRTSGVIAPGPVNPGPRPAAPNPTPDHGGRPSAPCGPEGHAGSVAASSRASPNPSGALTVGTGGAW